MRKIQVEIGIELKRKMSDASPSSPRASYSFLISSRERVNAILCEFVIILAYASERLFFYEINDPADKYQWNKFTLNSMEFHLFASPRLPTIPTTLRQQRQWLAMMMRKTLHMLCVLTPKCEITHVLKMIFLFHCCLPR